MGCNTICDYAGELPDKDDPDTKLEDWGVLVTNISTEAAANLLKAFKNEDVTKYPELWLAVNSTGSSNGAQGTELSGGNYSRIQVVMIDGDTERQLKNQVALVGPTASVDWEAANSLSLHSASAGGTYLAYGNLKAPTVIRQNKNFYIAAGALTLRFT
jgi:hypothetical protein